jgi:ABC-type polysaccharide/polyol phosphate transport system ATPase subunit
MNAIEFKNVSKKFRKGEKFDSLRDFIPNLIKGTLNGKNGELKDQEFWAVKDVSFELKKGEALGIIGPNGAGKSTILKMLSRILKPTKGEMNINGKLSALLEVGAGFHPDLTGMENIYLSGAIIGMRKKEIDRKLDSIIEFSDLSDFIDTPVKKYSSGMYVRLGFSVAAHMDPEILLIDEVLAVGDASFQMKCLRKIQEIRNAGTTIIFISHSLEPVRRLCPNTIFLKNGKINFYGESKYAIEQYLRTVNEKIIVDSKDDDCQKKNSIAQIETIKLYDKSGAEKNEFKTGDYVRIEIQYLAKERIVNPTFTVGLFLNNKLIADHNSRFEGNNIEFINGVSKIDLIIENVLLLPGVYEARAHIHDRDSIGIYDIKSTTFFIKESKRGLGQFYQPHYWRS